MIYVPKRLQRPNIGQVSPSALQGAITLLSEPRLLSLPRPPRAHRPARAQNCRSKEIFLHTPVCLAPQGASSCAKTNPNTRLHVRATPPPPLFLSVSHRARRPPWPTPTRAATTGPTSSTTRCVGRWWEGVCGQRGAWRALLSVMRAGVFLAPPHSPPAHDLPCLTHP